jgi:hypothetical protein
MTAQTPSFHRRGVLAGGGALAAAGLLSALPSAAHAAPGRRATAAGRMPLSFGRDGKFTVVQFNDTQDGPLTDHRTIDLMEGVLEREKPGFVVINGDVINGSPRTDREVKQAYNNVVMPMESRGIPWAITFGNHDEDSVEENGTSMVEARIVDFLRQYEHNLNPAVDEGGRGVPGESNAYLLIRSSKGNHAAFGLWLLDSGRYAPETVGGQGHDGLMAYDWIRPEQIDWYQRLSRDSEKRYGKVPSLMFFHIPVWEFHHMWHGQQFTSDDAGHAAAVERHGIEGVKNEGIYTGLVNSGMYAAALERGDVLGMYCGHDHINTFIGDYFGIELGYGPGTGFGTYGLNDGTADTHTLRGARVFTLDENAENVYTGSHTVFARDLGIDMAPAKKPLAKPTALPDYVSA